MAGDARSGAHWAQTRERSNRVALALMVWIALRLGRTVARWLLHPITGYFLLFSPGPKRQTRRYLRRALGREPGWGDHYRQVHAFASVVLDRVYLARGERDRFEALHAVGKGQQLPVAMAMYPDNARLIQAVLRAVAPEAALEIIAIGRPGSTLAIRDWLDGGGLVGVLGDRLPPPNAGGSAARSDIVTLPFLGAPARFHDGPLRLAMVLKRPVLFMVGLYRGGARYEVRFEPLVDFSQPAADAAGREAQLHAALQAYVQRLEALSREAPYNWFNFHDFWNEDGTS